MFIRNICLGSHKNEMLDLRTKQTDRSIVKYTFIFHNSSITKFNLFGKKMKIAS